MIYSNKLDLQEFFNALSDEIYCVIKPNEDFPNYYEYSDVDIFCFDINIIANIILTIGKKYINNNNFDIKVSNLSNYQTHIDFYYNKNNKLDFRFDLYQAFPEYNRVKVKQNFFSTIIENRNLNNKNIYVPDKIDDLILRYIEFIEYYDIRADKLKHFQYILDNASQSERKLLFDKLHYYTTLPEVLSSKPKRSIFNTVLKYCFYKLKHYPSAP